MGLVQTIIERRGIRTVSVSLLAEITRAVGPPRALLVDRPLGYPLDAPGDPGRQRAVVMAALALTRRPVNEPLLRPFWAKGSSGRGQAG